jgi:hypothetical protein
LFYLLLDAEDFLLVLLAILLAQQAFHAHLALMAQLEVFAYHAQVVHLVELLERLVLLFVRPVQLASLALQAQLQIQLFAQLDRTAWLIAALLHAMRVCSAQKEPDLSKTTMLSVLLECTVLLAQHLFDAPLAPSHL